MLIDARIGFSADAIARESESAETAGFDGLWSAESGHDPLLILSAASMATSHVDLGTSILVAFGRSPMVTAMMANDIQLLSKGRLLLGLGSQIRPHIENRFSMPWSQPAARMREYVLALQSIWNAWNSGDKLDFRGEFYKHTLMTPFFNPGPNPFGPPKVFLAAVGERMTEVAGEVSDGLLIHPFTTMRYIREVTMPALERGAIASGRNRTDIQIAYSGLIATGTSLGELEEAKESARSRVSFYGSTPAYRGVLELHGWGDLQLRLNSLSKQGKWSEMTGLIDDDILDAFCIVAPLEKVGLMVKERFGGVVDRLSFNFPHETNARLSQVLLAKLRGYKRQLRVSSPDPGVKEFPHST